MPSVCLEISTYKFKKLINLIIKRGFQQKFKQISSSFLNQTKVMHIKVSLKFMCTLTAFKLEVPYFWGYKANLKSCNFLQN